MDPVSLYDITKLEDLNERFHWLRQTKNQHKWRLLKMDDRVRGGVKGLPVYGTIIATDGMEAILLKQGHTEIFICHLDNFVADVEISMQRLRRSGKREQEEAIGGRIVDALANKYVNI